jgi:O-antigen ligase
MISLLRRKKFEPYMVISLLWPLALLAPFIPGIPRPQLSGLSWRQELVMAIVLACTVTALLFRRRFPSASSLFNRRELLLSGALLLFMLWSAASLFWATNPYPVLHHTFVWGIYLLFFILMRRAATSPRLLSASLVIFAAAIFIIGLATVIGALGASISFFRYNGLGEPMAVSVPLLTTLALHLRRRRAAILCGATALLAWLAMLQAYERTPFLSTTAGLILLALIHFAFPQFRPRNRRLRLCLMPACFILITALQFTPSVTSIVGAPPPPFTVYSRLQSTNASDENTLARFLFWNTALEMLRERPLTGVGANHYGTAFPETRARFVASHPDYRLSGMLEGHLAGVAHNEYLQILAELGLVGFALFMLFALALVYTAWLALRRSRSPLAPGAICTLAVFAINSGASSISFRWLASGLIFFFAAALVTRLAAKEPEEERAVRLSPLLVRRANAGALVFTLLILCGMSAQALSVIRSGQAQDVLNAARAEDLFRSALFWNPLDGATHFTYGQWLYQQQRYRESIPHLRFGIINGISTSLCYAYLSSAQMKTGEMSQAELTLDDGLKVYPRSVFLRISRASLLAKQGKHQEADAEIERAIAINEPSARGWRALITLGKEEATRLALKNPSEVSAPGSLAPYDAVMFVLSEKAASSTSFARTSSEATPASARR